MAPPVPPQVFARPLDEKTPRRVGCYSRLGHLEPDVFRRAAHLVCPYEGHQAADEIPEIPVVLADRPAYGVGYLAVRAEPVQLSKRGRVPPS